MGTLRVNEIINSIERLSPEELAQLTEWFDHHVTDQWDQQIAADHHAGQFANHQQRVDDAIQNDRLHDLP